MGKQINILLIEDNSSDADLITRQLKRSGIPFNLRQVSTQESFRTELDSDRPDLILSDYSLPSFDGVTAFHIKQKKYPGIPFIIVSGVIGEENAAELIKIGVTDYVLKDKLFSLDQKIIRALKEASVIKAKQRADEQLKEEHHKLLRTEAQVRNFAGHLNKILEEERAKIAREIHDDIGQQLVGMKIHIQQLRNNSNTDKVNELVQEVDVLIQSLRKIATELRPGILDSLGLIPSIDWLSKEFEKKTNIKCDAVLEEFDEVDVINKEMAICFFRICQESLTNVSKHANASRVVIELNKQTTGLYMKIADNGKGIANKRLENPFSMGLLGMRERANLIGGNLSIDSKEGKGTTIQLRVNRTDKIDIV